MSTREREKAKARKEARKQAAPEARLSHVKGGCRKMRTVADQVRGKPVGEALATLNYVPRAAAAKLRKLLDSAVANADQKGVDLDKLVIGELQIMGADQIRRYMPRAMGRAFPINKQTSHAHVVLHEKGK